MTSENLCAELSERLGIDGVLSIPEDFVNLIREWRVLLGEFAKFGDDIDAQAEAKQKKSYVSFVMGYILSRIECNKLDDKDRVHNLEHLIASKLEGDGALWKAIRKFQAAPKGEKGREAAIELALRANAMLIGMFDSSSMEGVAIFPPGADGEDEKMSIMTAALYGFTHGTPGMARAWDKLVSQQDFRQRIGDFYKEREVLALQDIQVSQVVWSEEAQRFSLLVYGKKIAELNYLQRINLSNDLGYLDAFAS